MQYVSQHLLRQPPSLAQLVQWHFVQHGLREFCGLRARLRAHCSPQFRFLAIYFSFTAKLDQMLVIQPISDWHMHFVPAVITRLITADQ